MRLEVEVGEMSRRPHSPLELAQGFVICGWGTASPGTYHFDVKLSHHSQPSPVQAMIPRHDKEST